MNIAEDNLMKAQDYIGTKSLAKCRMTFRLRTRMFECRGNLHGKFPVGDRWCRACSSSADHGPGGGEAPEETQDHIEVCPAYEMYRVARDVADDWGDKADYFMEVEAMRVREGWR